MEKLSEEAQRLYTTFPFHVAAELRQALDAAAMQYGAAGRVTVDASVLRELIEAIESAAQTNHEFENLADAKAKRIREVLAEHEGKQSPTPDCMTCGAPTDGECHYESPVPALCEAVDNLLDDL